ncbi:MAG: cobalt ECF transporter T component CbiQ [Lachnospirales bacterium]
MKIIKALLLGFYCYVMLFGLVNLYVIILAWIILSVLLLQGHSHNGFDIDYIAYNSALYIVNPYLKTLFFVAALILCISVGKICVLLFTLFSMAFITIFIGKIPYKRYISLLTVPFVFIMLSTFTMALELKGGIHITRNGQIEGLKLFLTALSGISCLYGLALSTPMSDLIEVLKKIKVPSIIIELMFLIYRFVFVLSDTMNDMRISAKVRGGFNNYRNSIYSCGMILSNLLIYSLKKSNNFYDAMLSRCYNGNLAFYCEYNKIKITHIIYCIIYFVIAGVICLV